MKINCNDGCLDNYAGQCVKYTDTQIDSPLIPQNTNLNVLTHILVNTINDLKDSTSFVVIDLPTTVGSITTAALNLLYPDAKVGFSVFYTNITGSPNVVHKATKINTSWVTFVGSIV